MEQYQFEKIQGEKIQIYTDGGCMPNPGSGAWSFIVVIDDEIIDECHQYHLITTNNEMELTAIYEAMVWTICNTEHCDVTIYSDSQYAINCITEWYDNWINNNQIHKKKNIQIISNIMKIYNQAGRAYKLKWIKGHDSNKFNIMADQNVKELINSHHYSFI